MAGWDAFLTDLDKEVLNVWGKTQLNGFGERPALLIIDDYYAVLGTERQPILESIKTWPVSCGLAGWEAIDRTAELLAIARENGVPVVYTKDLEGFPSPWQRWRERYRCRASNGRAKTVRPSPLLAGGRRARSSTIR